MTELDKLDNLIDVVEAGEDYVERHIQRAFGGYRSSANSAYINRAYHGSLDAALALHEALLPGWRWQHGFAVGGHGSHAATVWLPHMEDAQWKVHFAVGETPARAWLLAVLKAYRSMEA